MNDQITLKPNECSQANVLSLDSLLAALRAVRLTKLFMLECCAGVTEGGWIACVVFGLLGTRCLFFTFIDL